MASTFLPRSLILLAFWCSTCLAFSPATLYGLKHAAPSTRSCAVRTMKMASNQGENTSRRRAMQIGLATSAVIKSKTANAQEESPALEGEPMLAPMVTIFDSRGCRRDNTEYKGKRCGDMEDEMCVKIAMLDMRDRYGEWEVAKFVEQRKSYYGWKYQDLIKTGYNGMYKVADS